MAGRINTRFVIILTVVLVFVVGACIAVAMYVARRDPGRYIAQAEALMAENNYEDAAKQLGRAFYAEDDNAAKVELLLRMAETYQQIEPEDVTEAQKFFRQVRSCWRRALDLEPSNVEAAEHLLALNYRQAELSGSLNAWSQLYSTADRLLKFAPDHELARRYRGISQVVQISKRGLGPTAREQARSDLETTIERDPNDADAHHYLSLLDLLDAEQAESTNRYDLAEEHRNRAVERVNEFAQAHPDSADGKLARFRILMRVGLNQDQPELVDQARDVLTDVEAQLLESDMPRQTREVATRVADIDRLPSSDDDPTDTAGTPVPNGSERAEKLLQHVVDNHPDDMSARVALADLKMRQRQWDTAAKHLQRARGERTIPVSLEAFRAKQIKLIATQKLADIHFTQRELASDPNQREQHTRRTRELVDELARLASERAAITLWMRGKLALIEDRPLEAVKKLEQADKQYEGNHPQVLLLLSMAYRETGQTGAAADTLARLVDSPRGRNSLRANLQLAELRLANDDVDGAERLVDRILSADPNHSQARLLKSRIEISRAASGGDLTRQDMIDQAIEKLQPLADENDRSAILQLARLHRNTGDLDAARKLLNDYRADHPKDIGVIQELVRVEQSAGRSDAAAAVVEEALEHQPDNNLLNLLLTAIRDADSVSDELERIISQQKDPVERALSLWRFYRRTDQPDKAEQALQDAIDRAPDDKRILEIRFQRALAAQDYEAAGKIVDQAAKLNEGEGADYAGGAFWTARLQLARDQYAQAAATLETGLEEMPSNSTGHLMLGRARLFMGDVNGAARAVERSLELKPDNASAWRMLHEIHDRQQQYDQALQDLRRALSQQPNDAGLFMRYLDYLGRHGDPNRAIEARERIARNNPSRYDNRRDLAELYLRNDQPDKARDELQSLLNAAPNSLANVAAMATYYARTDRFETGRQMIADFVDQRGGDAGVNDWLVVARYLRRGGQGQAALDAYRKAVALEDPNQQQATRELGDWLFTSGRFEAAADEYRKLLGSIQDNDRQRLLVWRRYVEALLNAGKLDEASRQLDQLLEKYQADAQALMIKGAIARRKLDQSGLSEQRKDQLREEAEVAYRQAVAYAPESAMAHYQRAAFRFDHEGELVQQMVRDDLQRAIELNSSFIPPRQMLVRWYLRQGDVESAANELQRFVSDIPQHQPAREQLAELYLRQRRFTELANLLDDSLRQNPGAEADWRTYRARMHQAQGQPSRALAELKRAYEADRSVQRAARYTDMLLQTGRYDQALQVLDEWPDQISSAPVLHAMRARALAGRAQTDTARKWFERALDMAGGSPNQVVGVLEQMRPVVPSSHIVSMLESRAEMDTSGVVRLFLARERMMAGQLDQAMQDLRSLDGKFAADSGREVDRQRMLARGYYQADQYEKARAAYERVLERAPEDLMALNNLAYLLAEDLDKPEAAMSLADRAMEIAGENPAQRANVLDTVGWVHFCNGKMRDAEQTLERSIRLKPMAVNHLHLAKVYLAQDRSIPAREQLIAASELVEEAEDRSVRDEIDRLLKSIDSTAANLER